MKYIFIYTFNKYNAIFKNYLKRDSINKIKKIWQYANGSFHSFHEKLKS